MTDTADIVVIGGGIIGCSVVYHLATLLPRDTRIVLLDRGPIAGGTSGSCMGHLMVTPDTPQDYAFSATSVRLWQQLHEQVGGFEHNPTGALYLADAAEDLELMPILKRQFEANGDRCDVLDGKQLQDLEPGLAADLPGALYYPGDGVVLPMFACGALLRGARAASPNVVIRPGTGVTGFDIQGGRVAGVRTAAGVIQTRRCVNAAGVWSPELGTMAGLPRLPIYPRAGNLAITAHHTTPVRTQLLEISYLRFAHGAATVDPTKTDEDPGGHAVNLQPQSNGSCLIGSTRQFRGMDRTLNPELLHRSLLRAQRYAPGLAAAPIVRTWVGLRPYSLDKHPLIGPWPHLDGMWIAAGHEGLGISLAPITGLLLAQQMAGVATAVDHTPYLPGRIL
ncbi:MAG: FAD-binding oxidoreductase [Planctomycetes bacterium]|nr:FAD-binding oxidoreductase [Planctomycetota bacterium]